MSRRAFLHKYMQIRGSESEGFPLEGIRLGAIAGSGHVQDLGPTTVSLR